MRAYKYLKFKDPDHIDIPAGSIYQALRKDPDQVELQDPDHIDLPGPR